MKKKRVWWFRLRADNHEPIVAFGHDILDIVGSAYRQWGLQPPQQLRFDLDPDHGRPIGTGRIQSREGMVFARVSIQSIPTPRPPRPPNSGRVSCPPTFTRPDTTKANR